MKSVHLYVAGCTENGGIHHFLFKNGDLEWKDTAGCDRPMYMDIEDHTVHVLLRQPFLRSANSGLLDFTIRQNGSLSPEPFIRDTGGVVACHLCHMDHSVYITNYLSGSICSTGGCLCRHGGRGSDPLRQEVTHPHCILPDPDSRFLVSADLGLDRIYCYDRLLNEVSSVRMPAGHGPRHLCFSEDGEYLFCANELASTVSVLRYRDGDPELLDTVSALKKPDPKNAPAAIRVKGNMVFVSQRGQDAISVLRWNGRHLELAGVFPCGGRGPRDFIITDGYLICANEMSNSISVLKPDRDTLRDTGIRYTLLRPLCVAAIEFK